MAWRPTRFLKHGELDNTTPGKVVGWMGFAGKRETVVFDLVGDFHRDIRGTRIQLSGDGQDDRPEASAYMDGVATRQEGKAGDITAGLPPTDYVDYPYVEWYSEANGRVVLELDPDQVKVVGIPMPHDQCEPVSRAEQGKNMGEFLLSLARDIEANPGRR